MKKIFLIIGLVLCVFCGSFGFGYWFKAGYIIEWEKLEEANRSYQEEIKNLSEGIKTAKTEIGKHHKRGVEFQRLLERDKKRDCCEDTIKMHQRDIAQEKEAIAVLFNQLNSNINRIYMLAGKIELTNEFLQEIYERDKLLQVGKIRHIITIQEVK